jgi:23S rRNA (guanosine2251-2'-O)-methyltransferase
VTGSRQGGCELLASRLSEVYNVPVEHLEGWIQVEAALRARRRAFEVVLAAEGSHAEGVTRVVRLAEDAGIPVKRVLGPDLDAMAHGRTHGGVIAVCSPRAPSAREELDALLARKGPLLLLLLEGVEDARNLGFTLRSADALGADGVFLKKHVWEFDPVDVARAASGAWDTLPIFRVERGAEELEALRRANVSLWGLVPNAGRPAWDAPLAGRTCLAAGGEKRGLSAAVRDRCDGFLTIPMREGGTSLSLSHAAAAALAEAARQRFEARRAARGG